MVFEAITKALTTVKDTVGEIRRDTQAAADATVALDKGVVKVINTATEEASKIGAAAAKFMDGLKTLGESKDVISSAEPTHSAPQVAARIKQERVSMFAANPEGPLDGRDPRAWRDKYARPGYQQEPKAGATASPQP